MVVKKIIFSSLSLLVISAFYNTNSCYAEESKAESNDSQINSKSFIESISSKVHMNGWFNQNIFYTSKEDANNRLSFAQRNLNLISSYDISDNLLFFTNLSWSNAQAGSYENIIGSVKLDIEQAWVSYIFNDSLKIKMGQFINPFGLWNQVRPANISFLSVYLPQSVYGKNMLATGRQSLFSETGRGILLHGNSLLGNVNLDYNFYLTQSSLPSSSDSGEEESEEHEEPKSEPKTLETKDLDDVVAPVAGTKKIKPNKTIFDDKGIGGKIQISPFDWLKIGGSFYTEINDHKYDSSQTFIGGDLSLNFGNFEGWAEVLLAKSQKVDASMNLLKDFQDGLGYYVWLSYNTDFNLTPYVMYSSFIPDIKITNISNKYITAGLNYSFTPQLVLKNQYNFIVPEDVKQASYHLVSSQFAISF